jgi:rubrerythrin
MKSIKGSKTEKNLLGSFAGESQARNRYSYFASVAKRKAMSRFRIFLKKQPITKKNTPNACSNFLKAVWWR